MLRNKILDTIDYDLVITCKEGVIHTYYHGKELIGITDLKFYASIDELPTLIIEQKVTDKNGNFCVVGKRTREEGINENI